MAFIGESRRKKELEAWAAQRGYTIDWGRDGSVEDAFPELGCLREGDDRYGYEFIRGQWEGRAFNGFSYHYETSTTDSKGETQTTDHYFSVAYLESEVPLQSLLIRSEGIFDKVATFFGKEDINFESAEFSKKFYVTTENRKWAYDVIHTRTMEFLLGAPRFTLQMSGNRFFAIRNELFKPADYDAAAGVLAGVLDNLPEYVVTQQREQREWKAQA